jgi:hypothetical protein
VIFAPYVKHRQIAVFGRAVKMPFRACFGGFLSKKISLKNGKNPSYPARISTASFSLISGINSNIV